MRTSSPLASVGEKGGHCLSCGLTWQQKLMLTASARRAPLQGLPRIMEGMWSSASKLRLGDVLSRI